ncbi:MAG TPA: hypothetical protein VMN60_12300 [Longimicrobiales bacterium]|nr:hypothetical protein [Longimicrobiales bacterium]
MEVVPRRAIRPDDPRLLAQLVFCLASSNQLEKAEAKLGLLPAAIERHASGIDRTNWNVIMAADRWLIAFRRGLLAEGHDHYEQAMRTAKEYELNDSAAIAILYYAREVTRTEPEHGRQILGEARSVLTAFHEPLRHIYEQVLLRAEQQLK